MKKKYCITQIGHLPGKVLDFEKAIMVKVIPSDFAHYYYNENNDPNYEEVVMDNERLLLFKNYKGKEEWLAKKEYDSDEGKYWEIDLEDFTPAHVRETNYKTGEVCLRTLFVVNMVNPHLDVIEAKERGLDINVKNGSQRLLESLDLETIGGGENKYCIVSKDEKRNIVYVIPCASPERDEAGNFHVDALYCLNRSQDDDSWFILKKEKNVGIYNYMTRQFFKFADK